MVEGDEMTLTATVKPDDATDKTITWNSDKTDVATVDNNGQIKALKEGNATITAMAGDKKATCQITVSKKTIPVESIFLDRYTVALLVGESTNLIATVSPSDATDKTVEWSSSNSVVATVDQSGKVTAKNYGMATITVTSKDQGKTATCAITVTNEPYTASSGEIVDLGLSVKWSSCNLGATKPEEYGDYFAWGDVEPYYINGHSQDNPCVSWRGEKSAYNWANYKWCMGSGTTITKYGTNSSYGIVDMRTVLKAEDDVAQVILEGNWRMPTEAEWTELRDNCTWTWTYDYNETGVAGRIVTSKVPGYTDKSIFLPSAGYRIEDNLRRGYDGYYWSSSLYTVYSSGAHRVYFTPETVIGGTNGRCLGFSVRPVYCE